MGTSFIPSKYRKRRHPARTCGVLFLYAISVYYLWSALHESGLDVVGSGGGVLRSRRKVAVWDPNVPSVSECTGTFASEELSPLSDAKLPELLVRDALPDTRSVSRREFRERHEDTEVFERIQILVSTHVSTWIVNEKNSPEPYFVATGPQGGIRLDASAYNFEGLELRTDYVYVQDYEDLPGRLQNWTYTPGKTTKWDKEMFSWNIIVSVVPSGDSWTTAGLQKKLMDLSRAGVKIVVPISYTRHGEKDVLQFNARMSLSCIYGWQHAADNIASLETFRFPRSECTPKSTGAVLACGSPMRGIKVEDPSLLAEVAHFAVRALEGAVQFNHVAVQVSVKSSISQDIHFCKSEPGCMRRRKADNREHLHKVASALEKELGAIGVSEDVYKKISVIPWCRLGSVAWGSEVKNGPCDESFYGGQVLSTSFMYTLLSSEFKWAASWDLDEYLVPLRTHFTPVHADKLFDDMDVDNARHFWIGRVPIMLPDPTAYRMLTTEHFRGLVPRSRAADPEQSDEVDCSSLDVAGGKAAIKCDIGSSLKVHAADILHPGMALDKAYCARRTKISDPVLIHARLAQEKKSLACEYVPRNNVNRRGR